MKYRAVCDSMYLPSSSKKADFLPLNSSICTCIPFPASVGRGFGINVISKFSIEPIIFARNLNNMEASPALTASGNAFISISCCHAPPS